MLQRYIAEYEKGFTFSFSEQIRQQICGVNISIDVLMFMDGYQRRQMAQVLLEAEGRKYECHCVDVHNWEDMFYPVTLEGRQLLCFRKTLYGFTLLDSVTLEEVYEYFPSAVMDGEESFIIQGAEARFDLLFFPGCYWADVYGTFVFDPATKRFTHLSQAVGLGNFHSTMHFEDDQLILRTDPIHSKQKQVSLFQVDIHRLIEEDGTANM